MNKSTLRIGSAMNSAGRLNMKSLVLIGTLLITTLTLSSRSDANPLSTPASKLSKLSYTSKYYDVSRHNSVMVQMDGVTSLGNCPANGGGSPMWFILDGDDAAMVAFALASYIAGQEMIIYVNSDQDLMSGWCRVWSIETP